MALDWAQRLLLCCGMAALTGCVSHRPIEFGMYAVPVGDLPDARALGLDFVVGPKQIPYLDAARKSQLKVIGQGSAFPRHPALIGNYLSDEPDLRDIVPSKIKIEYQAASRRSSKPVFLNLSTAYSFESYARYSDVPMFDWYPVGWEPVETYFANLRIARLAAGQKPFFATVQVFDWTRYPKLMPPSECYRLPTGTEVKAMALWAAMNGAAGILFYPFDDGVSRIVDTPELVVAIREAIQMIRAYEPYFTTPRIWAPYPFQFKESPDKENAIYETSIAVRFSSVPGSPCDLFVVAANTTSRNITVELDPQFEIQDFSGPLAFEPLEVKLFRAKHCEPNQRVNSYKAPPSGGPATASKAK